MIPSPLVAIRGLDKAFEDRRKSVRVLRNLDLTIRPGECVGLVGASGSGKSTLARMLCKIHPRDGGAIEFNGVELDLIKPKDYFQQVQMVFQNPAASFAPRMTVGQYLLEPFKNYRLLKRHQGDDLVQQLLARVGLPGAFAKRYPNQLSGGQLQRLAFARATGIKPSLLICDEATSALDATIQKQIIELFRELQAELGFACLFITHDLALAESLCDTIHVMDEGRIVESLSSGHILAQARHPASRRLIEASRCLSASAKLTPQDGEAPAAAPWGQRLRFTG